MDDKVTERYLQSMTFTVLQIHVFISKKSAVVMHWIGSLHFQFMSAFTVYVLAHAFTNNGNTEQIELQESQSVKHKHVD